MFLGFDIGGTKCAVILAKEQAEDKPEIIAKTTLATKGSPAAMIQSLFMAADELLQQQQSSAASLNGIGISCGGPLSSKKGLILSPPNMIGWDHIPIVEMTEKYFNVKTVLQNDANAGAVAEWKYGAGKGYENIIFLTFGTGMGAGLILNGKLYSGTTDLAGEVGHIRLAEMGPVGFGKAGSFEGYCSGGGIARLAQIKVSEQLQVGKKVSFCDSIEALPGLTAKVVADAAKAGDAVALDIYDSCAFYLGRGLSLLIDILNPQVIILGSIYGRCAELLDSRMRAVIAREALADSYADCKILPAGLGEAIGDYAALSLAVLAVQKDNQ